MLTDLAAYFLLGLVFAIFTFFYEEVDLDELGLADILISAGICILAWPVLLLAHVIGGGE